MSHFCIKKMPTKDITNINMITYRSYQMCVHKKILIKEITLCLLLILHFHLSTKFNQ